MRRRSLLVALAYMLAACGNPASDAATSTSAAPATPVETAAPASSTTTEAPPEGVRIETRGWVVEDRRGLVLCPWEGGPGCPGLVIEGSEPLVGETIRVVGRYDGRRLATEAIEEWSGPDENVPLPNPCTGRSNMTQPPFEAFEALERAFDGDEFPPGVAQTWVSDGQVVVGFQGDGNALADELRGVENICVATGYEFSARELGALFEAALDHILDAGVTGLGGSTDAREGRADIWVDAIGSDLLDEVAARFGPAIRIDAFIIVLDEPLATLPEPIPVVEGAIEIPTGPRTNAGMMALFGAESIDWDDGAACMYVDLDGTRIVIVWPFGFTATLDPLTIYDPAGEPVLTEGEAFEIGGGHVGTIGFDGEPVLPERELCGADDVFLAGSGPTIIGDRS